MKIAILTRKWSTRGGNEKVATELARLLAARGHELRVVCQKIDPSALGILSDHAIHRLPGISIDPTLAMLSFAWSAAKLVRRLRRERAIDVAFGFNHTVVQDVYRLGGGTHAEFLALGGARSPLVDRAALYLEQRRFVLDGGTTRFIAPSARVKEELVRHYRVDPARIEVILNGVDRDRFTPEGDPEERRRIRREWGVAEDAEVAIFVGHELQRKGFAQAAAAAERANATLVAVSRAPRPKALPAHVVWDGERHDLPARYRAADALILPSTYDPFGGVVQEALASGLPAVATRRIGATERCAGTALERLLVSDPDELPALARCLSDALDPTHRALWRDAAREATKHAGLEAWAREVEAVLARR